MSDWKQTLQLLRSGPVLRRAAKYMIVVGALLLAINHGDAILRGDLAPSRWFRMGLTVLVPFGVSAFSSVDALREERRSRRSD